MKPSPPVSLPRSTSLCWYGGRVFVSNTTSTRYGVSCIPILLRRHLHYRSHLIVVSCIPGLPCKNLTLRSPSFPPTFPHSPPPPVEPLGPPIRRMCERYGSTTVPQMLPHFHIRCARHTRHPQSTTRHPRSPQRLPSPRLPPPARLPSPEHRPPFRLKIGHVTRFFRHAPL